MITHSQIIDAVARMISVKTDVLIVADEDQVQNYMDTDNCLLISISPITSEPCEINANMEMVIIDIFYYLQAGKPKDDLYEVANLIKTIFARSIKVGDKYLHTNSINENYIKDEIGWGFHTAIETQFVNILFDSSADVTGGEHIEAVDEEKRDKMEIIELMKDISIDKDF